MTITYIKTELAPADNQLAAYLYFTSDTPVSYSYTVTKRTTSPTSVDFTYTSDLIYGVTQTIKIPVIGLYAQYANSVQVVFKDDTGTEVFNQPFIISTEDQEYDTSVIFHLDIEQTDPALFTSVWGNIPGYITIIIVDFFFYKPHFTLPQAKQICPGGNDCSPKKAFV